MHRYQGLVDQLTRTAYSDAVSIPHQSNVEGLCFGNSVEEEEGSPQATIDTCEKGQLRVQDHSVLQARMQAEGLIGGPQVAC